MDFFGCETAKYKLLFDRPGFRSGKTEYAEGESVTAVYDMIVTDTDYSFYTDSDDVKLFRTYDNNCRGYVFTFLMPAHDVKLFVRSRNSMTMDPNANRDADAKKWICPECGAANTGKYCSECGHARL